MLEFMSTRHNYIKFGVCLHCRACGGVFNKCAPMAETASARLLLLFTAPRILAHKWHYGP